MRIHGDIEFVEEHTFRLEISFARRFTKQWPMSDSSFEPLSHQDARIADRSKIPAEADGIRIATTRRSVAM